MSECLYCTKNTRVIANRCRRQTVWSATYSDYYEMPNVRLCQGCSVKPALPISVTKANSLRCRMRCDTNRVQKMITVRCGVPAKSIDDVTNSQNPYALHQSIVVLLLFSIIQCCHFISIVFIEYYSAVESIHCNDEIE